MRLAISYALAQSAKLSVFEGRVMELAEETKDLPESLAERGKVDISSTTVRGAGAGKVQGRGWGCWEAAGVRPGVVEEVQGRPGGGGGEGRLGMEWAKGRKEKQGGEGGEQRRKGNGRSDESGGDVSRIGRKRHERERRRVAGGGKCGPLLQAARFIGGSCDRRACDVGASTFPHPFPLHTPSHLMFVCYPRAQVAMLIGKVFLQSSSVNLLGTVLDKPSFFWTAPDSLQVVGPGRGQGWAGGKGQGARGGGGGEGSGRREQGARAAALPLPCCCVCCFHNTDLFLSFHCPLAALPLP